MERVVASHLHSKRILEKQLNEIEAKQHQNEARRLKQIRDLGVDLSKIQRTTRDLDDVIQDLSSRNHQQRRGSLPPLDSRGGLPLQVEQQRTPRSRRRLSCIADISMAPRDNPGNLKNANSGRGSLAGERHKQLPAIKKDNSECKSKLLSPDYEISREKNKLKNKTGKVKNSNDFTEVNMSRLCGPRGKTQTSDRCTDIESQRFTAKIHMIDGCESEMPIARPSSDEISEIELQSIFADAKRSSRRSSEPELRSNYIRGLQDITLSDMPSFQYPNDAESEELRKSIQKNLPSDIVAETDEDEQEAEASTDENVDDKVTISSSPRPRHHLSSISETEQDDDSNETSSLYEQTKHEAESKNELEGSVNSLKIEAEKKNFLVLSRRRKSDGDVFIHGFTRKFNSAEKSPFGKFNRGKISDLTTVSTTTKQNFMNIESLKSEF